MKVAFLSPFTKTWSQTESKINSIILILIVLHNNVQTIHYSSSEMTIQRSRDVERLHTRFYAMSMRFCFGNVIDM